jgi:hypothetical protein
MLVPGVVACTDGDVGGVADTGAVGELMVVKRCAKYPLTPSPAQSEVLARQAGAARALWNLIHAHHTFHEASKRWRHGQTRMRRSGRPARTSTGSRCCPRRPPSRCSRPIGRLGPRLGRRRARRLRQELRRTRAERGATLGALTPIGRVCPPIRGPRVPPVDGPMGGQTFLANRDIFVSSPETHRPRN